MALRATVHKVDLQINDLDRPHYAQHSLQLAQHPSETSERLMVRLLAFALHDAEGLQFGRGLSADDEATLWRHGLDGTLLDWVEVGLPDERMLKRACNRAARVVLYTYGGRGAGVWWAQNRSNLARLSNLQVFDLETGFTQGLAAQVNRSFSAQLMRQDGEIWFSVGSNTLQTRVIALQS